MPFVYKIDDVSYELKYGSYLYDLSLNCGGFAASISIDDYDNMVLSSGVAVSENFSGNCNDAWPGEPLNAAYFQDEIHNNSLTGHVLIQNEIEGIVYATYLGGSESDFLSTSFLLNGNLFLVGSTGSDIVNEADIQFPLHDPETDAYFQGNIPGVPSQYHLADIFLTKICMDFSTSVKESILPIVKEEFPFAVFPNPALSEFTVLSLSSDITLAEIELLDLRGKVIRNYGVSGALSQNTIPISDISTGIYIVRIRTNDNSYYSHKLVIK